MSTAVIVAVGNTHSRQWARIAELFFAPSRLFNEIARDGSWWLPFVLTVVCSLTMTLSAAHLVGFREMAINTMRGDPSTATLLDNSTPADQRESAISTTETTFKISAASTPALILLYNALYGLLLWCGLSIINGGRTEFRSIFAVLLYADLIQDVRAILGTLVLHLGPDPNNFNIQNPFGSNLGYYLGADSPAWLRTFLETMDGLTLWYLALIAVGCSIVAKTKRSSTVGLVFGLWLFIVVIRLTWAVIA